MKYTQIQRGNIESIITIGEYIQETAPEVFIRLLLEFTMKDEIIKGVRITVRRAGKAIAELARIMKEPPKPGKGGLLPGETEKDLYEGSGRG